MNQDQTAPYLQRRATHAKWQSTIGKRLAAPPAARPARYRALGLMTGL